MDNVLLKAVAVTCIARVSSASPSELNVTRGIEAETQSGERFGLHFTQLIRISTSLTARHKLRIGDAWAMLRTQPTAACRIVNHSFANSYGALPGVTLDLASLVQAHPRLPPAAAIAANADKNADGAIHLLLCGGGGKGQLRVLKFRQNVVGPTAIAVTRYSPG